MAARIRVTLYAQPGGPVVGASSDETSRDDLQRGQQVVLWSIDAHTSYSWTLAHAPHSTGGGVDETTGQPSQAAFLSPDGSASRTARFNVDFDGAYLVRLVVDAGLPTESVQFLRLRQLTRFGDLRLPSAGERNDLVGKVPVDAPAGGWANDDNANVQRLLLLARRQATSGRVLWVDANRGRETSNDASDPTVLVSLPGPVASDLAGSGMALRAQAHGDFATITAAMSYAMAYASRGESAPSETDPWIILIQPGLYEEDLTLQSHVHLVGLGPRPRLEHEDGTGYVAPVVLRTLNAGDGTHGMAQAGGMVVLSNLALENVIESDKPVLDHSAGTLVLDRCVVFQRSTAAGQLGAIVAVSSDPADAPRTVLVDTIVASAAPSVPAIRHDAAKGVLEGSRSMVLGWAGILFNGTLWGGSPNGTPVDGRLDLGSCQVRGRVGHSIRSAATANVLEDVRVGADAGLSKSLVFDAFGQPNGAKAGDLMARVTSCRVEGDLVFNAAAIQPAATSGLSFQGTTLGGKLSFPGGAPDGFSAGDKAQSIDYEPAHLNPVTGVAVLPATRRLAASNVQDAIDAVVAILLPDGPSPGPSLDAAYDGLASANPPTRGEGLGREIMADKGAVQIIGAEPPDDLAKAIDPDLRGGLQVEGVVDIGPVQVDGLGSEVQVNPNPQGAGPRIELGRTAWANDVGNSPRGISSATIQARGTSAPRSFHLRLRTKDARASQTGSLGRLILEAGSTLPPAQVGAGPDAGSVHILAGSYANPTAGGHPGDVVLVPGTGVGEAGRVYIAKRSTATQASLRVAGNPPNGLAATGVAGTLVFATPNGEVPVALLGADAPAQVATKINETGQLAATIDGNGRVTVKTVDRGPDADVLFVRDTVNGALNVALGDFRVSQGAVYVQGAFADKVGLYCDSDGVLTVDGTIVSGGGGTSNGKTTAFGTVDTTVAGGNAAVATAVPNVSFDTNVATAYMLKADIVCNDKTDHQVRIMQITQAAYRPNPGPPVVDNIVNVVFASGGAALAAASAEFAINGDAIELKVTGVAGKDVRWRALAEMIQISEPA